MVLSRKTFFQNSASNMANRIIVDIVKYIFNLMLSLANSKQLIIFILFPSNMEWEPEKKKNWQQSEDERWARLDKRIESSLTL